MEVVQNPEHTKIIGKTEMILANNVGHNEYLYMHCSAYRHTDTQTDRHTTACGPKLYSKYCSSQSV